MCTEKKDAILSPYLFYDFKYEGQRHKGTVVLDEDTPNLDMRYDDHAIEITWVKQIRHKGKHLELCIVVNDDAYDANEGKVTASAWVCVYKRCKLIESFEPDCWSYIDETDESNNTCKRTFYTETPTGVFCELCDNPKNCKRRKSVFS